MNRLLLRDELIRDEGLRLKPYVDSAGKVTIGFGRNLDDKGITADEASVLLMNDIAETCLALDRALPWFSRLDDVRQRVLANMAFNVGVRGLLKFSYMLAAVENGDWTTAARGMRDSKWAKQVGSRAVRLSVMMETGTVPTVITQANPRSAYRRRGIKV